MNHRSRLPLFALLVALLLCTPATALPWAGRDNAAARDTLESPALRLAGRVLIRGGCPYNLDKVCERNRKGKLVHCHCQS